MGYASPSGYASRNALVVENQGLIHAVARKAGLVPETELYAEAIGDAQIELVKAASRYDASRGAFSTYAWPWLARSIADTKANQGIVHIPAEARRNRAQAERLGGWCAMVSMPGHAKPFPDPEFPSDGRPMALSANHSPQSAWIDGSNETEAQLAASVDMHRALALLTAPELALLSELIGRKDETRWNHLGRPAHDLRDLIQAELE